MCTALNLCTKDHYFGRNLDLDFSYGEEICVMPRNYPIKFRHIGVQDEHYAMIGMGIVVDDVPLYYDATNEYGLSMAGLNFPENAYYESYKVDKDNVAPFEFIMWVLAKCKSVEESMVILGRINLVNTAFSEELPLTPLHWIVSDKKKSIVVESMRDGLHIYDNPVGVLTNNPPFNYQIFNLNNYRCLRVDNGENHFLKDLPLSVYSQGLGAIGLPGDISSMSRFVRMVFGSNHSVCEEDEKSSISQFFHLLSSVEMVRGCCLTDNGRWEITVYSSCVNTDKGIYYYTTYDNSQINFVDMHSVDLCSSFISRFPLITKQKK